MNRRQPQPRKWKVIASLRGQILLVVILQTIPLLALAGASYYLFQKTTDSVQAMWVEVFERMMPIIHLNEELHRLSLWLNDYHLSRDTQSREAFWALASVVDKRYSRLEAKWTRNDYPDHLGHIDASRRHWVAAKTFARELMANGLYAHSPESDMLKVRFVHQIERATTRLEHLHRQVHAAINTQRYQVMTKGRKMQYVAVTLVGVALVVSLAIVLFFVKRVLKPLQLVEAGAREFGRKNFRHRIDFSTDNELGQLAKAFNSMADRLERVATRDGLTGVFNKQEILRVLRLEGERAVRHGSPLCFMMMDLDHFKSINDRFGHPAGDAVLRQVARCLSQQVRGIDYVGRFGGEEFCVLLPRTTAAEARVIAERLRQRLADQPFPIDEGAVLRVTLSIGIAMFPDDVRDSQSLVKAADQALYAAKNAGRNRVMLYSR